MSKGKARGDLAPRLIAVAVASCFASAPVWGNPTGAQVVNGTVGFSRPNASTLKVTNSPGAVINWQGFSIGPGEITRFIQESSSSAVLNRVVGADISSIQGQLLSNGRVFLINPSGIVVGPGAVIDTAGFVGSTLAMQDADFLAGKLKFQGDASSGRIVNQGWIRTGQGGQVMLVAPQIENSGLIHTPKGELILAAGRKLTISSLDHEGVQFEVQAPTDSVMNVGRLLAEGGAIGVFAGTLKHSGEIRATSLSVDATGQIVLNAQKDIELAAGSITSASGVTGGKVQIQSGDTTLVSGSVGARGIGEAGQGGTIHILGDKVGLIDSARINASGETGDGTILVGGDYKGENPGIRNASATFVGADTTLRADATAEGRGGRIILWSDEATRAHGTISTRGANGGKGGFVETSSKGYLEITRGPDVGTGGTWLLDPLNIEVVAGNATNNNTGVPDFTPTNTNSQVGADLIVGRLNLNANVTLDTNVAGADLGNITINSPIIATPTGSPILTLNANNLINIAQPISLTTASVPAGQVRLIAGNGITQALAAPITANMLLANGGAGNVDLQAANMVGTLAGRINVPTTTSTSRSFLFNNGQALTVGTVGGVSGVNVNIGPTLSNSYTINIDLETTSGDLIINQPVSATLSILLCVAGSTCANLTAPINLSAARDLNVNQGISGSVLTLGAGRDISVSNLNAASAEIRAFGEAGTGVGSTSSATLDAGRNLTITNSNVEASSLPGAGIRTATLDFSTGTGSIDINGGSSLIAGINPVVSGTGSQSITLTGTSGVTIADSIVRSGASFGARGPSTIDITASAGPIQVTNSSISAFAGDGGDAMISLTGNSITLNAATLSATGGSNTDATAGAATIQLMSSTSLDVLNGSSLTANGGFGFDGGPATVSLTATTGAITINNSSITAAGGSGSGGDGGAATVSLLAPAAGITVNNSSLAATAGNGSGSIGAAALLTVIGTGVGLDATTITATGSDATSFGGGATIQVDGSPGNVTLTGTNITANGGGGDTSDGGAVVDIIAGGAILQTGGGALQATSVNNTSSRNIDLLAQNGIGATGAPIRVVGGFSAVTANNTTGSPSGDVVLAQTTGDADLSLYTVTNGATNGGVDIKAEVGSINVPAPGFSNPSGPITFRANSMDIQGPVTAALGTGSISLQTVTAGHPIDLGIALDLPGALGLSNAEIANLSGASLTIGSSANSVSVTDVVTFTQSLSMPGAITITGPGSLGIGGITNTVGSIAGTGGIVLSGGALDVGSDNTSTNFAGVISGTGGLTKQGTGTLTLSGANAYTGATAVNAGTLAIGAAERIDNQSAVTVAGGATFNLAGFAETVGSVAGAGSITLGAGTLTTGGNNASTTYSGVMSGTGGLTKQGTGTLTLSGANAYTGATAVNAGTLAIGAAERIDNQSAVTVAGGATFNLAGFAETVGSVAGAGSITLGAGTLTTGGNNASTTYSGVMSGTGGLTKQGTGTLTLSGANSYDGTTLVNAGVLRVANDSGLGTATGGTTVAAGAAVEISGSGLSVGESFTLNGSGVSNGGALRNLANTNTVTGPIALGSAARIGSVAGTLMASGDIANGGNLLTVTGAGDTTVSGAISGAGGLTKAGVGTLNLSGANTYAGTTTINAGTLATFNGAAIGDSSAVVMNGGTLSLAADETVGSLAGTSNVALGANTLTTGGNNASTTYSGVMSGTTGGLTKQGTGTLTLSGTNSYDGTTLVNAGVLRVANNSGLGTASGGTTVAAGAAVEISGSGLSIGESLTLNGSGVSNGGALRNLANANEVTGAITLGSATRIGSDGGVLTVNGGIDNGGFMLTVGGAGDTIIPSAISGSGGFAKQNGGTLTLSGTNTYTGATTVNAGILVLDGATLSGKLVNHSTTTVNGSALVSGGVEHSGTLNLNSGGSLTVGGTGFDWQGGTLAGAGDLALPGAAPFRVTGGTTHTLNGPTISVASLDLTGGSLDLLAGTVNVSDTITVGSGATLASQGATINAAGATLDLSGVFVSGAGSVTVDSMNVLAGGLLKGAGTLNADVNNSAGTVSPGLSPGILTINGNYTQGAGGTLNMEIGGVAPGPSGHDQLVVTGTATLDGTLNASLINGFVPAVTDSFTLIKAGSVTGTFATTHLPAGTFLAPSYLVSSFVVSTPPPTATIPPTVPPVVEVEVERLRKTVEEGTEEPEKPAPTAPLCL